MATHLVLYQGQHGDVAVATRLPSAAAQNQAHSHLSGAMTSAFPRSSSPGKQPKEAHHPMAITCLQWDCDGALNDQDREWMLQALAAQDAAGTARIAWKQSRRL